MNVWRRCRHGKASAMGPALLALAVPFAAISGCGQAETGKAPTESRIANPADIEALCKDWLYYRKKVIQYTAAGQAENAERARARFRQLSSRLDKYSEASVNAAFLRLDQDGFKP